jgi:hypothetical protein
MLICLQLSIKTKKGTTTMSEKIPSLETSIRMSEHDYAASERARKERIGKDPVSGFEADNSYKTSLKDRDYQEITVGMIDEKMLDLEEAGLESSANTKAYNDLRDMKDVIVDLSTSADADGMYGDAVKRAEKFKAEGDMARAAAAQGAAEFFLDTRSKSSSVEGASEDYDENRLANIQQAVKDHNDRRSRNLERRRAL